MYVIEECHNVPLEVKQVLKIYVKKDGFIAGGAARWAVMGDSAPWPSDIDIFSTSYKQWNSIALRLNHKLTRTYTSSNAIAWGDAEHTDIKLVHSAFGRKVQGPIPDVLDEFSLTTEQFALYYEDKKFWACYSQQGLEDTANRIMRINYMTPELVVGTGERLFKYASKGYKAADGEVEKIIKSWGTLTKAQQIEVMTHQGYGLAHLEDLAVVEEPATIWQDHNPPPFVGGGKQFGKTAALFDQMLEQIKVNYAKAYPHYKDYTPAASGVSSAKIKHVPSYTALVHPDQLKYAVDTSTGVVVSDDTKVIFYKGTHIKEAS